ncbi:MAG: prolipoprotein diacylglyceryl transferase [Gemmatimonadetes bacterium]|nr:prolipoprotein diacylglyceryl transferase [Gemmatimonadota bacterium]
MLPELFRLPEWVPLLGGEPITSFGVMMFLAFLTGGLLHSREMGRVGLNPDHSWDILFVAVIGGILGAKIYYVLLNFPRLVADPLPLLLARGGLVWYGGLLGATALVILQIRRLRLPLARVADATAAPLAVAYGIGRIGCFLVGDDYGRPTDFIFGLRFPRGTPPSRVDILESHFGVKVDPELVAKYGEIVPVHPTQLYETAISLVIFVVLWKLRRHPHAPGWLFMLYLCLAGAERLAVEFLRAKDDRFFGFFTLAQLFSLGLIAVGAVGLVRLARPALAPAKGRAAARR